jgi:hypothetical protein
MGNLDMRSWSSNSSWITERAKFALHEIILEMYLLVAETLLGRAKNDIVAELNAGEQNLGR